MKDSLINAILGTIAGGGLVFTYFRYVRSEYNKILNYQNHEIRQKNRIIKQLTTKLDEYQLYSKELEKDLLRLMDSEETNPLPFWLKGIDGKMIYVNKSFEDHYNIKLYEYRGALDTEINKSKGDIFRKNDLLLINSQKQFMIFTNEIPGELVSKWKVYYKGKLFAIAGRSVPLN